MLTKDFQSDCAANVISGLNFLAQRDLRRDEIPLDATLEEIGIDDDETLGIVRRNVNAERRARGEEPLPDDEITGDTTVQEVIDYVCG